MCRFYPFYCRYLVPADLTVGQFVYVVRKRIKLSAEKAIFVFVKDTLPSTGESDLFFSESLISVKHCNKFFCTTGALMSAIYEENKDEDGFLYMSYSGENTFGFLGGQ